MRSSAASGITHATDATPVVEAARMRETRGAMTSSTPVTPSTTNAAGAAMERTDDSDDVERVGAVTLRMRPDAIVFDVALSVDIATPTIGALPLLEQACNALKDALSDAVPNAIFAAIDVVASGLPASGDVDGDTELHRTLGLAVLDMQEQLVEATKQVAIAVAVEK